MSSIHNPRQVVLISSRALVKDRFSNKETQKDNIMPVAWHMPVSFEPLLYAISIGKKRYSYNLINGSKIFVVNFMDKKHEKEVLFCGRNSGEFKDKFSESGLTKEDAAKVECCRIKEALGYMECKVVDQVEAGDHIIFIGKCVHVEEKKDGKKLFHLGGNDFTTTL